MLQNRQMSISFLFYIKIQLSLGGETKFWGGKSQGFTTSLSIPDVYVYMQIADFGMSRDLMDENYYTSHGGMIPVKWTAPEVFITSKTYLAVALII